ncbi:MAG TPA: hypothetical protein VGD91_20345 [Trebonia sp.]
MVAGAIMAGMYLWELVGYDTAEGSLLSGIDDDLAAAMRACALLLGEQRAFVVRIAEVVARLAVFHQDEIYVPTGREWLGRRTTSGGVHWAHTFRSADPDAAYSRAAGSGQSAVVS